MSKHFIWESHSIHAGTFGGPVKHGIDDIDGAINRAIELGHPSISFIIHTPRLTTFRYKSEEKLELKFIRGDHAYTQYVPVMHEYRKKYAGKIDIRIGIELEWQGGDIGTTWSRAKVEQALGVDFIVGSVHFSNTKMAFDESREVSDKLIKHLGSLENFWSNYLDEVTAMIDNWGDLIHVVGHLDLPKIYADVPDALKNPSKIDHPLADKLRTILMKMADKGIALDVNYAGVKRAGSLYPSDEILKVAKACNVQIALGTDAHAIEDIGAMYDYAYKHIKEQGFTHYVSFRNGSLQVHFLNELFDDKIEELINRGLSMLSKIKQEKKHKMDFHDVHFFFGSELFDIAPLFPHACVLGPGRTITLRKEHHSISISDRPKIIDENFEGLYFKHTDRPGVLALLFSILASEGINVDTACLYNGADGTGEAYITLSGATHEVIENACAFARGTNPDSFIELKSHHQSKLPKLRKQSLYLHEIDDMSLPMGATTQMIYSVHEDRPGILFLLLAALAARGVNILDLRLSRRTGFGHAIFAVSGNHSEIEAAILSVKSEFVELSYLEDNG